MKPNRPAVTISDDVRTQLYESALTSMEKAGLSPDGQHLWQQLYAQAQCGTKSTVVKPNTWRLRVAELVDSGGEPYVDLRRLEKVIDECMSTVIECHNTFVDPLLGKSLQWAAAQLMTLVRVTSTGGVDYLEWSFGPTIEQMMCPGAH